MIRFDYFLNMWLVDWLQKLLKERYLLSKLNPQLWKLFDLFKVVHKCIRELGSVYTNTQQKEGWIQHLRPWNVLRWLVRQMTMVLQVLSESLHLTFIVKSTRGTAGRRSPALIHKWNNLTVQYVGLISPMSPSS